MHILCISYAHFCLTGNGYFPSICLAKGCNGMTLLYKGMLFVCVSCKPVWRYALTIRMELRFSCGEETMVNVKVKMISLISG